MTQKEYEELYNRIANLSSQVTTSHGRRPKPKRLKCRKEQQDLDTATEDFNNAKKRLEAASKNLQDAIQALKDATEMATSKETMNNSKKSRKSVDNLFKAAKDFRDGLTARDKAFADGTRT